MGPGPARRRGCRRLASRPCPLLWQGGIFRGTTGLGERSKEVGWPDPHPQSGWFTACSECHSNQLFRSLRHSGHWFFIYIYIQICQNQHHCFAKLFSNLCCLFILDLPYTPFRRVLRALCQEPETEQYLHFLLFHHILFVKYIWPLKTTFFMALLLCSDICILENGYFKPNHSMKECP